jgi:cell wall-associated NlpC family hydrolase
MPHPSRSLTRAWTRLGRRALAAGVLAGAALAAIPEPAGAAPVLAAIPGDPHSLAVIERAGAALAAHDVYSWTRAPDPFAAYVAARHAAADAVAVELGLDPAAVRDAWARADLPHQEAVLAALSQIDRPYVTNTSDPTVGFDCSGLTAFAWGRAGLTITRQSSAQLEASRPIGQAEARAGDLAQYPGHVMMYLGVGDAIVHAANHSTDVAIGFLSRGSRFGDPTG